MNTMLNEMKRHPALTAAVLLWLLFIWGNSCMPASVSSEISTGLKNLINYFIEGFSDSQLESDGVLRKIAHASEFALLSFLLFKLFSALFPRNTTAHILFGVLVSLTDETIQLASPGRSGTVKDIWIDLSGYMLLFLVMAGVSSRKQGREESCQNI